MSSHPYLSFLVKLVLTIVVGAGTIFAVLSITTIILVSLIIGVFSSEEKQKFVGIKNQEVIFGKEESKNTIVSIPITGVIVGDESDVTDPLGFATGGVTYGYSVKKQLMELADEEKVKGVILEINSPGGTIYGAQAIADGVAYYREKTHKPVFSFVSGIAASGAYWSAVSTDRIIADVGTSVGSIGVISGPYKYYDQVISEDGGLFAGGVVTQKGIETTYITAGKYKDMGNPYRKLSDEEKSAMQQMVNNEYERFVLFVSARRNIPSDTIKNSLGALLYDIDMARTNKLIDESGNKQYAYDAIRTAAQLSENDYNVIQEVSGKSFIKTILESKFIGTQTVSYCKLTKVHLVYYGDIMSLCQ